MRRTLTLLAALTLSTAPVACSSDLADDAGGTEPAGAPVTTEAPAPPTAPTSGSSVTLPGGDLAAVLLTVDDLGAGWQRETDVSPQDVSSIGELPCPEATVDAAVVDRLVPTAVVMFSGTDPAVLEGIQEFVVAGDADRLAADLDALFAAAQRCLGAEWVTDDGERVRYDPFDLPDLGDQRLAGELTVGEPPDFTATTWRGHSAIVRVGELALMINQFEILPTPEAVPAMDANGFVALLEAAVARLAGQEPVAS